MSGEPSAELLSNTITSKGPSSLTASMLARHLSRSSLVFQEQIVILTLKSGMGSACSNQGTKAKQSAQQWQEGGGYRRPVMLLEKPRKASVRFPNHALAHLLRAFSSQVFDLDIGRVEAWPACLRHSIQQVDLIEKDREV